MIFQTEEQAKIELQIIKHHLLEHPYLELNENLLKNKTAKWSIVEKFDV